MKLFILGLLVIYSAFLHVTHAEAQAQNEQSLPEPLIQNVSGRDTVSLDGQWTYIIDPYENGYYNHRYEPHTHGYFNNSKMTSPSQLLEYNFDSADKITVPGDWNTQEDHLYLYEGTVWYNKNFTFKKQRDQNYLLYFGAVNYKAIVYVNGNKIGEHEGGFTSFNFDITQHLKDGDNFVTVKVDNRRERDQVPTVNTDWWNYGGITRSVSIVSVPQSYLSDYRIQLSPDKANTIKGTIVLAGPGDHKGNVAISIPELGVRETVKVNKSSTTAFSFTANPALWSPDTPKLYDVEISYNGETIHDRIGFRTIETQGEDILLNGQSIFLKGISIHEESPLTSGRAWSEEDARTLLQWAKELGCNFVRLAHYPHNEHMLRVADEMGLMVWTEIPVYWTVLFDNQMVYRKAEQQLAEMIHRDINRASVIMWSMANETPSTDARLTFISSLIKQARQLDSTRLITAAMDTQSSTQNGILIDDPLASEVDIIGVNSYCGWYVSEASKCSGLKWESKYHKPIIMSELGAGALQGLHGDSNERWTEEFQASVYVHNLEMVDNMSALRGLSPWILKDFRSPRRPLKHIQDFWNRKGLVSEKGIRKKAWYVLRDYYETK